MTKDEALKLALEALERCVATCFDQYAHQQVMSQPDHFMNQAITAIKEALAQEQEPVAWGVFEGNLHDMFFTEAEAVEMAQLKGNHAEVKPLYAYPPQPKKQGPVAWWNDTGTHIDLNVSGRGTPLYTHPLQRTWVGLTAKEKHEFRYSHMTTADFIEVIEAKLKERNT